MNRDSNAVPDFQGGSGAIPQPALATAQPFRWSVRREVWENRSIYIAPLAAGAVYFIGYLISLHWLPHRMRGYEAMAPEHQTHLLAQDYAHPAMLLILTAFLVGIFYSLDALHGERRDRSILFWKSMPVSDRTTVLSKATIPLICLPVLAFAVTIVLQVLIRAVSLLVMGLSGSGAGILWDRLPLLEMQLVFLYSVVVITLWHAPIYCWFILVSGWARRAAFLWAVLPWLALSIFEFVAFRTSYVGSLLRDRFWGFVAAFQLTDASGAPIDAHFIPLSQLAPGTFLASPGLWLGLGFAALCLIAAVRLRRYQGPL
jgi:ABC-2 type transport system permease protein